jgi:trigger factor
MKVLTNKLPKSQLELTFELEFNELKKFLEDAASEMTTEKPLTGFRPGKAPYDIVKQRLGETAILQKASNPIITKTYFDYIEAQGLETVDQPNIEVVKMAADNPFIFKATISLLPKIELVDFRTLSVKKIPGIKIEDAAVEKVITDLRKMRVKEALVDREVKTGDKVELNFETFIDTVAIPGGKAEKYPLVVGDKQMIEGFEENLIGMKKDQEKEFELSFPKKYHNEKIAGKKASFKVKVLSVFERQLPELNEEFAKGMGLPSVEKLRDQIKHNLEHEKEHEAEHKQDMEILTLIIEKSKFEDLPDVLINDETHKMLHELEDNLAQQGMNFKDYLNHVKKTEAEMRLDFTADAIKRVKTALAIRQIANNEKLTASEEEIDKEADLTLKSYKLNPAYAGDMARIEDSIKSPSGRRYLANVITNQKVIKMLRKELAK